jgi:carboxypeptidase Taq
MKESLDFIYKEQKDLSNFSGIAALLGWDQMTYMPPKGIEERSEQISLISRLAHEKFISDKLWNHVRKLADISILNALEEKDKIVVIRLEKDIEKARKIPTDFVEEMSKATSLAYGAWQEAREKNKFTIFASHLEKIVELEKKYCEYMSLPGHPYNSLLDDYEEGMTVEKLQNAFSYLKPKIIEILNKIKESEQYVKQHELKLKFEPDRQKKISQFLLEKMFLPEDQSRLDVSTHPFTTSIGYDDVRITTNFGRGQPLFSFFSTMHEAGHALYELGLPKGKFKDTVISDASSLGLNESQSRFWENMIGHSRAFWNYFYPIFQKTFPDQLKNIDFNAWHSYVNQVKPSFIRIEADELTYCLHVILRFEIEMDLVNDKIKVSELPRVWNEKMEESLDIVPKTDKEGVLQDMHWSGGDFGYYPTYAIGTMYAAQLFNQLVKEKPEVTQQITGGEFKNIIEWLNDHIYKYGRAMTAEEIIKNTCHEGLNPQIFVDYLKNKYFSVYEI